MNAKSTPNAAEALAAIRAKCLDCCGNQRKVVERCLTETCPLYPYRSLTAMGIRRPGETESGDAIHGQTMMNL